MGCVRRSVVIYCHIGIPMVGNNKNVIPFSPGCPHNSACNFIDRCNCFHYGIIHTCMSNHIAICKIEADKIEFLCVYCFYYCILHKIGAHLGLQVVCCYLRRRNKDPLFVGKCLFPSSGEEKGYMSIFFSLGYPELGFPFPCENLTNGIICIFLWINNMQSFEGCIIRSHCAII